MKKKRERAKDKKMKTKDFGSWVVKKTERARDKTRGIKVLGSWGRVSKKRTSRRSIKQQGLRLSVVGK